MRRILLLLIVFASLIALAGCASTPHRNLSDVELLHGTAPQNAPAGRIPTYIPTGKLIADTGFRPNRDGFPFENYGSLGGIQEMSPAQVEDLFGPEVCAAGTGATCRLIPPARTWLETENLAMAAGHCFGMAVASGGFFSGDLHVDLFGANAPASLALSGNASLQQKIAEANALQEIPAIRRQVITGSPNELLDTLIASLQAKSTPLYTLGLYRANGAGGHAVTPFAVEDRGDGRFAVLVYDSNHPHVTRAISFDRHADAWRFVAQSNPNEPKQIYQGHGHQSLLALYPARLPLSPLPCPFCNNGHLGHRPKNVIDGNYIAINEIALSGNPINHAHLLITDRRGRRVGYVGTRFLNEIPGVKVIRRLYNRDWLEASEPVYLVPVGVTVTVTVDGRLLKHPVVERLDLVGPGDDLTVGGIALAPGEKVHVTFKGDGSGLSYTTDPHHSETALLKVGVEDSPASYGFSVTAHRLPGGATVALNLDERRRLFAIHAHRLGTPALYDLRFDRITNRGIDIFEHDALPLRAGDSLRLNYRTFTHHHQTLPLRITNHRESHLDHLAG